MSEGIPSVNAFSEIHQGDLILDGNNVTTIEGSFGINGSIIVRDNATLILRNAVLNFVQESDYQHNVSLQEPLGGNPRLQIENSTITSNNLIQRIYLYGNSSASIDRLTAPESRFMLMEESLANFSDTTIHNGISTSDTATLNVVNSSVRYMWVWDESNAFVSDSIIEEYFASFARSANLSITKLTRGYVDNWDFKDNCSILMAPDGSVPSVTFLNTEVGDWSFDLEGSTNATVLDSWLDQITIRDTAVLSIHNSYTSIILGHENSCASLFDSRISQLQSFDDSRHWLVNSTSSYFSAQQQSQVHICWRLNVHVIDSVEQDVQDANVTVAYSNSTLAQSSMTNADGLAELVLTEKVKNATGDYPVGNYTVEAVYETYSDGTTVNMTDNQLITLTLEGLVVPEFPSILILPLFMIMTLLAVIVYRKKHAKISGSP